MNPRIVVVSGVRTGEVFPLSDVAFVIGRSVPSGLSLADESLSRRHCMVTFEGRAYHLQDCHSVNGTAVNGKAVTAKQELHHGDRIDVGTTELVFLTEASDEISEPAVYFDDTPIDVSQAAAPDRSNVLLDTLLQFSNSLRHARDTSSVREQLLSFVFAISPADRAAILLIDRDGRQFDSVAGRDRPGCGKVGLCQPDDRRAYI